MLLRRYHNKNDASESIVSDDKQVSNTIAYDDMTKKEVMEELEKRNIEFVTRQSKAELLDLLMGSD